MIFFGYVVSDDSDNYSWYITNAACEVSARSAIESTAAQQHFDDPFDADIMETDEAMDRCAPIEDAHYPVPGETIRFDYGS